MSLVRPASTEGVSSFPRVSGDEPVPLKYGQETTMFSPRERG